MYTEGIRRYKKENYRNGQVSFEVLYLKNKKNSREIVLEQNDEIIMTILPSQLRQIQELFEKETEGKATCELITLNQQKNQDEILK